ncbi:MAG: hypothetical protein QM757_39875 [Paludibaculum sp.]
MTSQQAGGRIQDEHFQFSNQRRNSSVRRAGSRHASRLEGDRQKHRGVRDCALMLLMMAEVLRLGAVYRAYPDSWFWSILAFHQNHVAWAGCSLHDMYRSPPSRSWWAWRCRIIAARMAKGGTFPKMFVHAIGAHSCWPRWDFPAIDPCEIDKLHL